MPGDRLGELITVAPVLPEIGLRCVGLMIGAHDVAFRARDMLEENVKHDYLSQWQEIVDRGARKKALSKTLYKNQAIIPLPTDDSLSGFVASYTIIS
jgi:hypothetical protein